MVLIEQATETKQFIWRDSHSTCSCFNQAVLVFFPPYTQLSPFFFFFSAAIAQELAWANAEDNPYLFTLVGKLAELQFIQLEAEKQMAETVRKLDHISCYSNDTFTMILQFLEVSKAFRHIFQEERMVEETKREQQNYLNKVTKLQKQLEATKKKGDQPKVQLLEADVLAVSKCFL